MAYLDGSNVTSLASVNNAVTSEFTNSRTWFPNQTTPISLVVSGGKINGQYKWLPCNNSLGPTGHLVIGGPTSTAVTITVEVEYTCHFKQPTAYGFESKYMNQDERKDNDDVDETLLPPPLVDPPRTVQTVRVVPVKLVSPRGGGGISN